jgi:hypothetical protein
LISVRSASHELDLADADELREREGSDTSLDVAVYRAA